MSKYRGPRCRRARRIGSDLSLTSGIRALDSKCKLATPPGMHGAKRVRISDYGRNLIEKQRICWTYGVSDTTFYRYHLEAIKQRSRLKKGTDKLSGEREGYNLLKFLECRLDNVVFRMGFSATRAEARQLVNHRTILVNGQLLDRPSYAVKLGDQISIRKTQARIQAALELSKQKPEVDWVSVDIEQLQGTVTGTPKFSADLKPDEVIAFYSK